jgi:Disulphide bond corrector protein DsbC
MKRLLLALALTTATAGAARAAESLYEITKVEPKIAVGATATASLTIKVKGGWHVNDEAPISVALTPPAGVTVGKQKLTRADLAASSKETARFDIPVSATEAGKKSIAAEAHFVLCQEQACKPVKETVTLAIEVTPPAAAKKKKN